MQLVNDAVKSWTGHGIIQWAEAKLGKIQADAVQNEQLIIFRGEDE